MDLYASKSDQCEFCFAFFADESRETEHNRKCEFRLSRTFLACDGVFKFACTVCRDVFTTEAGLKTHEELHKYPGGYACSECHETFRNETARCRHQAIIHQLFKCLLCNDSNLIRTETEFVQHLQLAHDGHGRYAMCSICNAYFDQPTYLRLHMEISCGRLRTWTCGECGIECVSADALDEHTKSIHSNDDCIKVEENPLILPKIEVSAIEYQCIDEEERQFATEYFKSECDNSNDHSDDEVFDNADAEAGMEWEPDDEDDDDEAIDIKDEIDAIDDIDQDEVNESDEVESEATITNEKHKCQYCSMVYTTLNRLLVHMKNHDADGKSLYKCNICVTRFASRRELLKHRYELHKDVVCDMCYPPLAFSMKYFWQLHMKRIHEKKVHECVNCRKEFETHNALAEHGRTKHPKTTCSRCDRIFKRKAAWHRHMTVNACENSPWLLFAVHKDDIRDGNADRNEEKMKKMQQQIEEWRSSGSSIANASLTCSICRKEYDKFSIFETHVTLHGPAGELTVRCKLCRKYFASDDDVVKHTTAVHLFRCHLCHHPYSRAANLNTHLQKAHNVYNCDQCGAAFDGHSSWRQHIVSSCGSDVSSKNYQCVCCPESFYTEQGQREHETQHETDATFPCSICGKTFDKMFNIRRHVAIAHRRKYFECRYCVAHSKFKSRNLLLEHLSKHMSIAPFKCLTCATQFDSMTKLMAHRSENPATCNLSELTDECIIGIDAEDAVSRFGVVGNGEGFRCEHCEKIVSSILSLKTHSKLCQNLRCEYCDIQFEDKDSLRQHMKTHRTFKCKYCNRKFASEMLFQSHVAQHGSDGKKRLRCRYCVKEYFETEQQRREHVVMEHAVRDSSRSYPFMCSKCGKIFKLARPFRDHEKSDCGKVSLFKCEHCDKTLSSIYVLQRHIEVHHQNVEKKLVCDFCGKRWHSRAALTMHRRYHTGEKPYKCAYCDRSFADRTTKNTHETTHTGIKPYMCQCGNRFTCISNLQSHRKARKTTCGLLPLISKRFPDGKDLMANEGEPCDE